MQHFSRVLLFGKYSVSDDGIVINVKSMRVKTQQLHDGYAQVTLNKTIQRVHRLVLQLFHIAPPTPSSSVNHMNGIKSDNRLSNLEWSNQSEQLIHAHALGLMPRTKPVARRHIQSEAVDRFQSIAEAGRALSVSPHTIERLCDKNIIRDGYEWCYQDGCKQTAVANKTKPLDCTWKQIVGFAGYEVSSTGLIWSNKTSRVMRTRTRNGYQVITLVNDQGGINTRLVHPFVATAFVGNAPSKAYVVDHINSDRADNRPDNLRWVTQRGNIEAALGIRVNRVDLTGRVIETFPSIRAAAAAAGRPYTQIVKAISTQDGWTLSDPKARTKRLSKGVAVGLYSKDGVLVQTWASMTAAAVELGMPKGRLHSWMYHRPGFATLDDGTNIRFMNEQTFGGDLAHNGRRRKTRAEKRERASQRKEKQRQNNSTICAQKTSSQA